MNLVTADLMRELDRITIEEIGIPGVVLMENAGAGCARAIMEKFSDNAASGVAVVCGTGNNGGDGFVIARHLWNSGFDVTIFIVGDPEKIKGDAAVNKNIADAMGIPYGAAVTDENAEVFSIELDQFGLIVDALFGTGLDREVTGKYALAIEAINDASAIKFAVDIPSGLNADTGRPMGDAVFADMTVTFQMAKVGQWLYPGYLYCGELIVVDISIPEEVIDQISIPTKLIEQDSVIHLFIPRHPEAHKGSFGHCVILGGSPGLSGAPVLAANAALRAGAGLVTVAAPDGINSILEGKLTEVMTAPMPQTPGGHLSLDALGGLKKFLISKSALAVGPGIGTDEQTRDLLFALLPSVDLPMVLDADALNIIAGDPSILNDLEAETILTPHPGEMARLTGLTVDEINENRIEIGRKFAADHNVILILKGGRTLIFTPDQQVFLNTTGNPAMATGGTGDVLTGIIVGLLSQDIAPIEAALCGVYLHGAAGDWATEKYGEKSMTAGDLEEGICAITKSLEMVFKCDFES